MAGERAGKCVNIGNCSLADKRETIVTEPGRDFVCPECGKGLIAAMSIATAGSGGGRSAGPLVIGGIAGLFALIAAGFAVRSCSSESTTTASGSAAPVEITAEEGEPVLRLGGSNTIGAKLAPALVTAYFKDQGCTDVASRSPAPEQVILSCDANGRKLVATIAAQGTGTAFEGLAADTFDIGLASRKIKDEEARSLAKLGDMTAPSNEHVIALDGIAVIVHPSNPISTLTQDQVAAMFTGIVGDFGKAGGRAGKIDVYARDDKSGTYDTFKTLVLGTTPLVADARRYEDSDKLSADVANDPDGIGFVGLSAIGSAKAVAIGPAGAVALLPNRFTVATEDYVLSRRLYLYSAQSSPRPDVAKFIEFANSAKGQAIVEATGFVPLTIRQAESTAPTGAPADYSALVRGALRLSVNFRFRTGSSDLDNRGLKDLDRVTEFLASSSVQPDRLMLLGFADSRGSDTTNQTLSEGRAATVAAALRQRGVAPGTVRGFGEAIPVADNSTAEGQEKNRRVEVWVRR